MVFLGCGAAGAAATGAEPSAPNPIESVGGPPLLRGRGAETLMPEPGGRLPLAMSGFSARGWMEVGPQPSPPPCSAVIGPRPMLCRPDTAAAAAAAPWALCGRSGGALRGFAELRAESADPAGCSVEPGPGDLRGALSSGGLGLPAAAASWLPSLSLASTARVCCCASSSCAG